MPRYTRMTKREGEALEEAQAQIDDLLALCFGEIDDVITVGEQIEMTREAISEAKAAMTRMMARFRDYEFACEQERLRKGQGQ